VATVVFVAEERCTGCGRCVNACPRGALYLEDGKAHVRASRCVGCELCVDACPEGAIYAVREPVVPARVPERALRPDSGERALQPAPSWVAGLGAVFLVAERLLPALMNLADALRTRRAQTPPAAGPSAPAGKLDVRQGRGRHRARNRRGSAK